jgi:nucleoside-diphosphate-sugar epimerase
MGDGTMKSGVPNYGMGVVDVRDVAQAHMAAGFISTAKGRYITSGSNTTFPEMAQILRTQFGAAYPFPKTTLPKPLVWLIGPLLDSSISRKTIARNVGVPFRADNSKGIRELGLVYRPLATSLTEMFQQMIDQGVVTT